MNNFDLWFKKLGEAWVKRSPEKVSDLFSDKFEYYETPFTKPYTNKDQLLNLWAEVPLTQDKVVFNHELICTKDNLGIARWKAQFYRKDKETTAFLDGIFIIELDKSSKATIFRQWWVEK